MRIAQFKLQSAFIQSLSVFIRVFSKFFVSIMATKRKSITINEIKALPVSKSPRKCSEKLACVVLSKSEVRPTRSGVIFSMNLCDGDRNSTLRTVCFDEELYGKVEKSKSYEIDGYKIKEAYGNSGGVEMVVDADTLFVPATTPLEIAGCSSFKIAQILRRETENTRYFNLKAKVVKIEEALTVGSHGDTKLKREIILADETGQIALVLWREKAAEVGFKEGDVVSLQNIDVSIFNKQINVTTSFETTKMIDEAMEVKEVPALRPKSNVASVVSSILAIKHFRCWYKCMLCKNSIMPEQYVRSDTLRCSSCSGIFLKSLVQMSNQCHVMLCHKKWYAANTGVSAHCWKI